MRYAPQNSEPLISTPSPSFAWERVGADLCFINNRHYLVVVDYLSRYPEVALLSSTNAAAVIERMKSIFARHGIPETVVTDNGPQFSCSQFEQFANDYGFGHITVSPRYPQANGEIERMVQTIKRLVLKSEDPYLALLAYRATPGIVGLSPAEILMGRRLRTRVPMVPQLRDPVKCSLFHVKAKDCAEKKRQARYFDKRHRARPLKKLDPGDAVWVTDMQTRAMVVAAAATPRSYVVRTDEGITLRRNRRMLNRLQKRVKPEGSYEFPDSDDPAEPRGDNTAPSLAATQAPSATGYATRAGRLVKRPVRWGIDEGVG